MTQKGKQIIDEIKKVIIGKDDVIEKVLMVVLASGHILLEDVPGMGKTTLALAFSRIMSLEYRRVQFTPDTMASDIVGFTVYKKDTGTMEYKPGAVFCNLLLADEINRTSPKTQAALLEAMEEKRVSVDGITHDLPDPFICIATQNPVGSAGTQNLPESQLDRFMVRLTMGYPTLKEQVLIIQDRQEYDPLKRVAPVVCIEDILAMRRQVKKIYSAEEVIYYCASLCESTRSHPSLERGVSPRAVMALLQMAKARAFLRERDYLIPEDVQTVFADVCAHRLVLTPQAKIKKESPRIILKSLFDVVQAPTIV